MLLDPTKYGGTTMDDVQSGAARGGHRPADEEVLRRAAAKLGEEAEALL